MSSFFEIPYYHDYVSPTLARHLLEKATPVAGVPGLVELGASAGLETKESLQFLTELYSAIKTDLAAVLAQRIQDRKFMDERVKACHEFNKNIGRDWLDDSYRTILGLEDTNGRMVIGPLTRDYCRSAGKPVAPLPEYLKGPHVTLFGPPDTAKMAINAMNAYHRKLPTEPSIISELLASQNSSPMWGADDEDSKTPLRADLVEAAVNLTACFDGSLRLVEGEKKYELAKDHLSLPIKRFPGLALPCNFLFYKENPIPLHLYDFALHLFKSWENPRALVFYVPKLENEEEARYIHKMISTAEKMVKKLHPSYEEGSVRLMIVLENPRAILRAHEIMDALHPFFAGASLGWHDYLASTARVFREDSNYRIPVKADPNIVIKYIKASHLLLADAVGSRGGIKVGGMYGILPITGHHDSLQVTLKGFIKDVITQMKRNLTGFWVAHPDFVRLGLAFVEAWKQRVAGKPAPLETLVKSLLDEKYHQEILGFIEAEDIEGLDIDNPNYVRSLIVADIKESDFIPNNHPDEIRYNVFQSLQYIADWLCGNGCVALPTVIDGIPVRVMDDLATAERSRWEVWHELRHGRFSVEEFLKIAHEEMVFIRKDLSNSKKIVQVKWNERTEKWYPVALKVMLQLMTDENPVEFASELLHPFTLDSVRNSKDPWAEITKIDPGKYRLPQLVENYHHYFEICGSERFARAMAVNAVEDFALAEKTILSFELKDILSAASFHGNIGESKKTLDARAASEQSRAQDDDDSLRQELRTLGEEYFKKFGFKFLISAQGKSATELLAALKLRLGGSREQELQNARLALWEITRKRMLSSPRTTVENIDTVRKKHGITGASIAVSFQGNTQTISLGESVKGSKPVDENTAFEIASLSKTIASAFASEYFRSKGIPLTSSVNEVFAKTKSKYRLKSNPNSAWAKQVQITHLMSHAALNMHYVNGFPADQKMPPIEELLNAKHGYEAVDVSFEPGKSFHYSGGGFIVLEHLIEALENRPASELVHEFLTKLGIKNTSFNHQPASCAHGYRDSGEEIISGRLNFPAFAAGALGTAKDMSQFLAHLTHAFQNLEGSGSISHDTAVEMLHGTDKGCRDFMGCDMGLGVFTLEAGPNRFALHQGANDGFRAIYVHCYSGPDVGKGITVFCNGDNRAVLFISEAVQKILRLLDIQGVDYSKFNAGFQYDGIPQEQIVNLGYKQLIFSAFQPDLPEAIITKGPLDPLATQNLAVGAEIVSVSNQKFARAENLISSHLPVFDPELFGRQGKIMDSWETARHNQNEYDVLMLQLKRASEIRYVSLSTKFHDGNQAEYVRLLGKNNGEWNEIIPKTKMDGHSLLKLALKTPHTCSQVRVEIYPDGGLSRLGLFGQLPKEIAAEFSASAKCIRFSDAIPKAKKPMTIPYQADEAELKVVKASNEHYGPASQVVSPFPPIHMFDGLESARSRKPGHHEEVVLQLRNDKKITRVICDFKFFVNNNPLKISIDGLANGTWTELVPVTNVKAFAGCSKEFRISANQIFEQIKIKTFPDGGINRIRIY